MPLNRIRPMSLFSSTKMPGCASLDLSTFLLGHPHVCREAPFWTTFSAGALGPGASCRGLTGESRLPRALLDRPGPGHAKTAARQMRAEEGRCDGPRW
jgi:hypothetical protein